MSCSRQLCPYPQNLFRWVERAVGVSDRRDKEWAGFVVTVVAAGGRRNCSCPDFNHCTL